MKKTLFLLGLLIIIMTGLLGLLVYRAHSNDAYFSEEESSVAPEI